MARLKKPVITAALLWRIALLAAVMLCVWQLGALWLGSIAETKDAMQSGRRLLIPLDGTDIQGNLIVSAAGTDTAKDVATPTPPADAAPAPEPESKPPIADSNTGISAKAPVANAAPVEPVQAEEAPAPANLDDMPAITPSNSPVAVENERLIEKTDLGSLPKIGAGGVKPWRYYAKRYSNVAKLPVIAVVVTGLGQNKRASELALRLPEAVSLSFSPYAHNLASWMSSARLSGHEMLLDLPAEPSNYPVSDPGPLGMLVSKDQDQNEVKMKKLMATTTGYVGFLTPQDEVLSSNNEVYKAFLQAVASRGLLLALGKPPHSKDAQDALEKSNVVNAVADTLIDEELTDVAIQTRLDLLEQAARSRGYAVGIAQGYPITMEQLAKWAATLEEKGILLVPVSAIVMQNFT